MLDAVGIRACVCMIITQNTPSATIHLIEPRGVFLVQVAEVAVDRDIKPRVALVQFVNLMDDVYNKNKRCFSTLP